MASTEPEKTAPPPEAPAPEPEKVALPPPEAVAAVKARPIEYFVLADVVLRVLLFASTLTSIVVAVTSEQKEYLVAALSVACLYSIITSIVSILALLKPGYYTKVLVHFVIIDVLILGILASATGAGGGVAYIGLKGNSHVGWQKICNTYDKFCQHLAGSLVLSLIASVVLVLLVILSVYSLSKKIP